MGGRIGATVPVLAGPAVRGATRPARFTGDPKVNFSPKNREKTLVKATWPRYERLNLSSEEVPNERTQNQLTL